MDCSVWNEERGWSIPVILTIWKTDPNVEALLYVELWGYRRKRPLICCLMVVLFSAYQIQFRSVVSTKYGPSPRVRNCQHNNHDYHNDQPS